MHGLEAGTATALETYFAGRAEVSFALLFGSQARGTATALSDVDVAVYFRPANGEGPDYQAETHYPAEDGIWHDLERITRSEVELVVLNRASPSIVSSAFRGKPLVVRDWDLYLDLLLVATGEADEFQEDLFQEFRADYRRA